MNNENRLENVLVTFDVDGTLLVGMGKGSVHRNSFKAALFDVFGINDELPKYRPGTDLVISKQIIETALRLHKSDTIPNEDIINKFIEQTENNYAKFFDGRVRVMPGITEALKSLVPLQNVKVALCTGNFKRIALLKVEKAGLIDYFSQPIVGCFGNDYESKTDILIGAQKNAEKAFGIKFDRFIHVGDTPEDVESANQTNTTSILVQTTPYDFSEAEFGTPSFTFSNLEDHLDDFLSVVKTGRATNSYYDSNKK